MPSAVSTATTHGWHLYPNPATAYAFRSASSGVGAVEAGKWQVYPNPAKDELMVSMAGIRATTAYSITDMGGRTVLHGSLQQQVAGIAVGTLQPGTYLLRLDGGGSTWQSLFVKN